MDDAAFRRFIDRRNQGTDALRVLLLRTSYRFVHLAQAREHAAVAERAHRRLASAFRGGFCISHDKTSGGIWAWRLAEGPSVVKSPTWFDRMHLRGQFGADSGARDFVKVAESRDPSTSLGATAKGNYRGAGGGRECLRVVTSTRSSCGGILLTGDNNLRLYKGRGAPHFHRRIGRLDLINHFRLWHAR